MATIRINGANYDVPDDPEDWTLGELADMQQIAGCSLDGLNVSDPRAIMALAYVAKRRAEPSTTVDEIRGLRVSQIEFDDTAENPSEADGANV